MEYHIALSPNLGVTPEGLVTAWNANSESRSTGEAHIDPNPSKQYDIGAVMGLVIIPLVVSISANAFYDLLKTRLVSSGVHKRTRLMEVEQPNGSRLLIVDIEEE